MSDSPYRSMEKIEDDDLARLAAIGLGDFAHLFTRCASRIYEGRLRLLCLCQGAARHFVFGDRGVQDFDVWGFFEAHEVMAFPCRRRAKHDFGPSRFGRNPDDVGFLGRRVDVIGRSLAIDDAPTPILAVRRYLREPATESAYLLAQRPVVVLWPETKRGFALWAGEPNQGWTGEVLS